MPIILAHWIELNKNGTETSILIESLYCGCTWFLRSSNRFSHIKFLKSELILFDCVYVVSSVLDISYFKYLQNLVVYFALSFFFAITLSVMPCTFSFFTFEVKLFFSRVHSEGRRARIELLYILGQYIKPVIGALCHYVVVFFVQLNFIQTFTLLFALVAHTINFHINGSFFPLQIDSVTHSRKKNCS